MSLRTVRSRGVLRALMIFSITLAIFSAAPTIVSCQLGPVCTSFPADAAEQAQSNARCAQSKGVAKVGGCDTAGDVAVCSMGDTSMTFSLMGTTGDVRAGQLSGFAGRCASSGGRVEKPVQAAVKHKRVKLVVEPLPLSTTASDDCEAMAQFSTSSITCGSGKRPDVSLTVALLAPDDRDLPQTAERAINFVEGAVETRRDETKTGWTVEYKIVPRHGVTARGFMRAIPVGAVKYLCQGSAFSEEDLKEALALCADLKPG